GLKVRGYVVENRFQYSHTAYQKQFRYMLIKRFQLRLRLVADVTTLWAANQFSGCLATKQELQEWSGEIG
nr:4-diphosphocytidyl-2-C-methyl-D-erythritol kinase, chloroplastic/chromoplastic [Tanacetum cinerariifolium]